MGGVYVDEIVTIRLDKDLCNELFHEWLRAYSDDPNTSNEVKDFVLAGTFHFHEVYQQGKITDAELGLIIDHILCR